ncbi:serine/arginine repetitive matrix protein 1-like isoform X1 [Hibiscus syriacus]|uniref:Serine/arginine repetitive matrix protein 1-like isoform X1 n=1 Tax=Hibiscus syriacus TaxID=106335 RepID=A0A6A2WEB3_HIBSY|nr:transcription initiation factor IIA large subunit-like [Hibiscus syriacus]KAE8656793.1 serine/arginine repetitive matrix protein 1-like isoform X1 [Hibiscus syriacus]
MTSSTTSAVYIHVIEDVINKVRDEFINNGGPGESVLNELQGLWEMKMMQAGAIVGPIERSSGQKQPAPGGAITPVHDLNVPYEGTEEYETPTADMLFPPTPLQTPLPTPLPGSADGSMYNIPTGGSDYLTPVNDSGSNADVKGGRPSPYMQYPSPWANQRTPLSVDVNVAYVEGRDEVDRGTSNEPLTQDFFMMPPGKRKREGFATQYNNGGAGGGYIPQQDGAGDATSEVAKTVENQACNFLGRHDSATKAKSKILAHVATSSSKIPQLDGPIPDPFDDMLSTPNIYNYQGVVSEDYNVANTPAPNDLQAATPAPVAQNNTVDDDDDEPLNEDDDDDDLDDVDQEELNTQHLVLAQFDKVTRTKSRWKCTLKDGIMHINNKDILFNKATGEFDF